jgi:hypothetical protein
VLATIVAALVSRPSHGGRQRPTPSGAAPQLTRPDLRDYTLVDVEASSVRLLPFDGRPARDLPTRTSDFGAPITTANGVAYQRNGQAYFLAAPFDAPLQQLGAADELIPGAHLDVGLQTNPPDRPSTVEFVQPQARTNPIRESFFQLPDGYRALAEVANGIVLYHLHTFDVRVWAPVIKQFVADLGRPSAIVGMAPTAIAWLATGCNENTCPLHITDLSSHADRTIAPPPGSGGFIGGGAFSPFGVLAAFVSTGQAARAGPVANGPGAQLVLVSPAGFVSAVPNGGIVVTAQGPMGSAVWSRDGLHLFFGGVAGAFRVYTSTDRSTTALPVPSTYTFTVY